MRYTYFLFIIFNLFERIKKLLSRIHTYFIYYYEYEQEQYKLITILPSEFFIFNSAAEYLILEALYFMRYIKIGMQSRKTFNFSNDFSIRLNSENVDNPFQHINLREQSMSSFQRYIPEDSRGHNIFNFDNTIGFADLVNKKQKQQFIEEEQFAQAAQIQSQSKMFQQPQFGSQLALQEKAIDRTSLKYFAKNLLKIMKESKQWFNLKQISQLLADTLSSKELREEEVQFELFQYTENQLKNIKRRCYDAINVMLAANVIERDGQKVRFRQIIKEGESNENTAYVSQAQSIRRNIEAKMQVLNIKKMAYQMSKEKKQAIAEWIKTKQSLKDSQPAASKRLQFPVMFLLSNKVNGAAELKERRKQTICLQGDRLVLMGQLDLIAEHRRLQKDANYEAKRQQGQGDYYCFNAQE